jgi:hypothetical protein
MIEARVNTTRSVTSYEFSAFPYLPCCSKGLEGQTLVEVARLCREEWISNCFKECAFSILYWVRQQ